MQPTPHLLYVLMVAAAAALVGACASTSPIDSKQAAALAARNVGSDVRATENQIDVTLSSLRAVVSSSQEPSQVAFDRFSEDVDMMRAHALSVDKSVAEMRKDGQTYLANWATAHGNIQNQELRQASEERRREILDRLQSMDESYNRSDAPLDAFIRNLEDVRTALANDFTELGVATVSETTVLKNAESNAAKAKSALKQMHGDSVALANTMPIDPDIQRSAALTQ
jgi:hypothetical protein